MASGHLRSVASGQHSAARHEGASGGVVDILLKEGHVTLDAVLRANAAAKSTGLPVDRLLLARRKVSARALVSSYARLYGAEVVSLRNAPPDPRLIDAVGATFCMRHGLLPWRQAGRSTVVVVDRPGTLDRHRMHLEEALGPVILAFAPRTEIIRTLTRLRSAQMIAVAEHNVPPEESCRTLLGTGNPWVGVFFLTLFAALLALWPTVIFAALCALAVLTLVLNTCLKAVSAAFFLRRRHSSGDAVEAGRALPLLARKPVVSLLVPLYREREIASHLIARLRKLRYPRDLLDVILITEVDDLTTRETLGNTRLPHWMRTVVVPAGTIKTKPRALNYALTHCRGTIIGVYDAEDAPDPDQINAVVARFAQRGPDVACLQGVLDFYNARSNWLSRCFAVEYAVWFRIVLPGLERLGLAVPLGGTTLFFRRDALERLGAWDAHNVTEDADLGIRLARHGYRAELIPTVTQEEANCRVWPWVKQRSRWLKGYALTWAVHMRNPARLWRDLGAWRFFGVQLLFVGTLTQFLLAPVLWSFWLVLLGLDHPLSDVAPHWLFVALGVTFLTSELLGILVGAIAVSDAKHTHLMKWVPTLHFYFPLGALASYKAIFEVFTRPFFWDKTAHGIALPQAAARPPIPRRRA